MQIQGAKVVRKCTSEVSKRNHPRKKEKYKKESAVKVQNKYW